MTGPLRILSLGAGVQSTTMALMCARGELPMPDAAIFADTGWEPKKVYEHLKWLMSDNVGLPFPVHIVSQGNIRADALAKSNSTGQRFAAIPWFTINADGSKGMGPRQCTSEYKLRPLQRKTRELLNLPKGKRPKRGSVEMMIGISTDEAMRMRPSRLQYIENTWPLINIANMSRQDCFGWMAKNGYPTPPKSSCIGCPFHSNTQWRDQKDNAPEEWADSVLVDEAIRSQSHRGIRGEQFMHADRVPLAEVDLRSHKEMGQDDLFGEGLFGEDCEGMCGI